MSTPKASLRAKKIVVEHDDRAGVAKLLHLETGQEMAVPYCGCDPANDPQSCYCHMYEPKLGTAGLGPGHYRRLWQAAKHRGWADIEPEDFGANLAVMIWLASWDWIPEGLTIDEKEKLRTEKAYEIHRTVEN